jgi:hypothetical protein
MIENRRLAIWNTLYGAPYRYTTFKKGNEFDVDGVEDFTPFDPTQRNTVKPYFPPTDFSGNDGDPFDGVLDAPMGG